MFKSVYKCKLCGGIVEVTTQDWVAKNTADRIMGFNDPFSPPEIPRQIHKCENGSRGLMEFLGFRFYGTKD